MKVILFLAILASVGCQSLPTNPESWMEKEDNACVPTAISFSESLKKQGIWSEVLIYSFNDEKGKPRSHAFTAYLYPSGQNTLWTYDKEGSFRTRAFVNDPEMVAQMGHRARSWEGLTRGAYYLK